MVATGLQGNIQGTAARVFPRVFQGGDLGMGLARGAGAPLPHDFSGLGQHGADGGLGRVLPLTLRASAKAASMKIRSAGENPEGNPKFFRKALPGVLPGALPATPKPWA